jgi:hypothetical protein
VSEGSKWISPWLTHVGSQSLILNVVSQCTATVSQVSSGVVRPASPLAFPAGAGRLATLYHIV